MTRKFVYWKPFLSACKIMGVDDTALQTLEHALLLDPAAGDMVEGTGGAYKVRIRLAGRGKSSGGRVIYFDTGTEIHFLMTYPKSAQSDLTATQKELLREATRSIRKER